MNHFVIEGEDFARAAYNALAFTPARSVVPAALLRLKDSEGYFLATDTYAIGRASIGPLEGFSSSVELELARTDLTELDKIGRSCKGQLRVTVKDDGGLIVSGMQMNVQAAISPRSLEYDKGVWKLCTSLLEKLDREDVNVPELLALDPGLLSRFGKIKTPKGTSPMLDLRITAHDEPILIKCGPQFTGALMPVDRDVAEKSTARGVDFLW
ncbi:hypothetical protein [Streptomyces crystallinus]|uniref:DNA polymerase III beta sliding clamp central domain-containing protein n=1 Tax=Streptomyces crystallinus TaxID=68191 RepID=A0ABN1F0K7_9ACTN